jgi:hypothetical protein
VRASFADARQRLRTHPDVPLGAKALLPLIRVHHARQTAAVVRGDYERRIEAVIGDADAVS